MAFVRVNSANAMGSTANPSTAITTPTAGNLLVAVLATTEGTSANVTNPSGWTQRANSFHVAPGVNGGVRIISRIADGTETAVTFTAPSTTEWNLAVREFSGNNPSGSEFDAASAGAQTSSTVTSFQPGSLTPTTSGELFVVACLQASGQNDTVFTHTSINSGFTLMNAGLFDRMVPGYKMKTDATAENPTCAWQPARTAIAIQCAFRGPQDVAGAGTVTPAGALTKGRTYLVALAGGITFVGEIVGQLAKSVRKFFTGSTTPTSTLIPGANPASVREPTYVTGADGSSTLTGADGHSTISGTTGTSSVSGVDGSSKVT